MKLTSWAFCSLALAAGVFGADRPELFKSLPRCTISCLEKYDNSDFEAVDMCNNGNVKQELDNCFADKCRDFERFDIAKIYANACDSKPKDNRHNHYVLLVAEIPAWISPWLRLYSSWATYENLSLDDYVMVVCGLLYTVFATLIHFAHSVTGDTILWNAVPEYITDGLKLVFMADIFELACSCLLRVAVLLVCLRTSFSGRYIVITAATLLLTILSSIALALLRVFRCSRIAFAWEGWEPNGRDEETGVLYRSSASEGFGRDQPPATDNRRDQYAGNTVNQYEDAEAESMSEGVVRDIGKEAAEETSRVELTPGR
ncbi:hypothetical protein ACKAV7_001403 [Fusarium commune]